LILDPARKDVSVGSPQIAAALPLTRHKPSEAPAQLPATSNSITGMIHPSSDMRLL